MRHKHYDCIVAWASGEPIEFAYSHEPNRFFEAASSDVNPVTWPNLIWRIKKEPVIEVKYIKLNSDFTYMLFDVEPENYSLRITYQDGVAIKAEVAE